MIISMRIANLACVAFVAVCGAAAAIASTHAVYAQSRSTPPLANPPPPAPIQALGFYQETKKVTCSSTFCLDEFTKIPTGKVLVLTNVNCLVANDQGGVVWGFVIDNGSVVGFLGFSALGAGPNFAPPDVYVSNQSMSLVLQAGHTPEVSVDLGTTQSNAEANCTIAGQLK